MKQDLTPQQAAALLMVDLTRANPHLPELTWSLTEVRPGLYGMLYGDHATLGVVTLWAAALGTTARRTHTYRDSRDVRRTSYTASNTINGVRVQVTAAVQVALPAAPPPPPVIEQPCTDDCCRPEPLPAGVDLAARIANPRPGSFLAFMLESGVTR